MLGNSHYQRLPERRDLDIETTAHETNGPELQVRIVNLTARGFCALGSDRFREGSHLLIMLPGYGEAVGRVVWVTGEACGGIFLSPIPFDGLQLAVGPPNHPTR